MATTVTPSDLTVTVNDSLTLNNRAYGGSTSYLVSSCDEAVQRIVSVAVKEPSGAQTWTTLFDFSTVNNAGQGIITEFQYFRVTNLDNANYLIFQILTSASNNRMAFKLEAGQSFILQGDGVRAIDSAAPGTGYEAFQTITGIRAAADTAVVDTEIVVAFKPAG
tara:strand:+ start:4344 stop:4835 length:492 start_codon:yes stop_codon:yes gene_type:complete